MLRIGLAAVILGSSLGAFPAEAGSLGGSAGETAADPASRPDARWHLYGGLGYGAASGGYGAFLEEPVQFELRIAKSYRNGAWRLGGGLQFGSLDMLPPYEDQKEWGRLETFGTVTRVFRPQGVLPALPSGAGRPRPRPPAQRDLLQQASRRPRAGREPDAGHERRRLHGPARPRDHSRKGTRPRRRRLLDLLPHEGVRPRPDRPAAGERRPGVRRAGGARVAAVRRALRSTRRRPLRPSTPRPGSCCRSLPRTPRGMPGGCAAAGAGPPRRCSPSTSAPRRSTSTCATPTSTRSARAASGPISRKASPTTTTSSRPTSSSTP